MSIDRANRFAETIAENNTHYNDLVKKIWEWLYMCTVPVLQSRSIEDIRANGFIMSGDKQLDKELMNDRLRRYMTINHMVEFFEKGVTIGVVHYNDTKEIYETVQSYLAVWYDRLKHGVNIREAPISDLLTLDKFATAVYPHAKPFFTPEILQSDFARHFMDTQRVAVSNLFTNQAPGIDQGLTRYNEETKKIEKVENDDRESFAEKFKQSAASLRRY